MGYTEFDIALLNAWDREHAKCKDDPARLHEILRRRAMSTYTRPLRSWSLVLRACDTRIDDNNSMGLVRMDGARIRQLCSPVKIASPVSFETAARLFGVNRTTVSRWADPADSGRSWYQEVQGQIEAMSDLKWPPSTYRVTGKRLMLEYFLNRADRKRSKARVWTPGFYGLDPGGEVYAADWGSLRTGLAQKVDPSFEQQLQRVDRRLCDASRSGGTGKRIRSRVFQWICPAYDGGCGRLVYKLYLPMPYWTLVDVYAGKFAHDAPPPRDEAVPAAFLCLRCAGLVYESSECTASPGTRKDGSRRRVNAMDRAIKRMSGGVLRGRDVLTDF